MGRAIEQFFLGANAGNCVLRLSLFLLLVPVIAEQPDPARADDNQDAASAAMQPFVIAKAHVDNRKPAASCGNSSPKDFAQAYYASNYLICLTKASNGSGNASLAADIGALNRACVAAFDQCIPPKNRVGVANICGKLGAMLSDKAKQVSAAVTAAASSTQGLVLFVSDEFKHAYESGFGADAPDFCNAKAWDMATKQVYATRCEALVNKQFSGLNAPQSACPLVRNYDSGARAACLASLDANLGTLKSNGKNLVGPNSDFCKSQQEWIRAHPCTVTSKTPIAGKEDSTPKIDCNTSPQKPPLGDRPDVVSTPLKSDDGPLKPPAGGSGGASMVKGSDPKTPPRITTALPKGGQSNSGDCKDQRGCGGVNMINGNTNEGPSEKIPNRGFGPKKALNFLQRGANRAPAVPARPVSSSGSNTSRSPGMGSSGNNSAMDRLGGMMSNSSINSVSSNQASSGIQGNGQRRPPVGSSGYNTSKPIPAAGSGGSVGSSGITTSRPIPSAPRTPAPRNDPIDYGGCAGCGRQQDDLHVR